MKKKYFYILMVLFCFASSSVFAQESKQPFPATQELGFYPNPVSNGKIYITSKTTIEKDVVIFDVLGKKVLQVTTSGRELNISNIPPGVYIIKIREGEDAVTKKLIVR